MKNKYFSIIVSSLVALFFSTVFLFPIQHLPKDMEEIDSAFSGKSQNVRNLFQDISKLLIINCQLSIVNG